jgi:hypothetical protein
MGALHFLEHEFSVPDAYKKDVHHDLELFEIGGELFFRLWVGGLGENKPVVCCLTKQQARDLAEGAEALSSRIGD